jgi:hypothetical protein
LKIQVGEEVYELEYTVNSVCDLEERTKMLLGEVLASGGYTSIRALLLCGLTEHNPSMTLRRAGELVQEYLKDHAIDELAKVIGDAIEQAGFLKAQGLLAKKRNK